MNGIGEAERLPLPFAWRLIELDRKDRVERARKAHMAITRGGKKKGPMGVVDVAALHWLDYRP